MDAAEAVPVRHALRSVFARGPSTVVLVMLAIVVAGGVYEPRYLSGTNLFLLSRQISFVFIASLGQFFVVLSRGMDLSVGAVAGLAGMVAAWAMQSGMAPWLAVLLALLVGLAVGLLNGVLVAYARIESFIVTIATGQIVGGLIVGLSRGWSVVEIPRSFLVVAQGAVLGVPNPVWIALLLGAIAHVALAHMALGRRLVALALNEEATFLSGIDTARLKVTTYVISSAAAALVGILMVARLASAQPDPGSLLVFISLACAVIPLALRMVNALGVALGAGVMGEIAYAMVLMRVDPYWQWSAFGVILVLMFVLDRLRRGPA
jgi:ribose transport system permease protein